MILTRAQELKLIKIAVLHIIQSTNLDKFITDSEAKTEGRLVVNDKRPIKNLKAIKKVARGMKRRKMTPAQKKAVSIRMKAYWAKRRKS
jgi:BRCT domain type II-containing protein